MISPLILISLLASVVVPSSAKVQWHKRYQDDNTPHPHPHNYHNPHRSLLKRSITADASVAASKSFDFVIAGGGCAGLALAARLTEWSNVTVLLIEAGGDGSEYEQQIDIPGYSYLNSLSGTAYDWQYMTTEQTDALGGTKGWPRGKGLGGSGAINGLFWGRGGQDDYDAWAALNPDGEQTWNWAEMQKYINKAEKFNAPNASQTEKFSIPHDASVHGDSGPINSGYSEYIYDAVANWVPAWVALGFQALDLAGGSTRGVTITTSTINPTNQTRSDSKAGYIDPLPPRSNLVILTGQQVTGVVFNGSTDANGAIIASGVTFQASSGATEYSVEAKKEVILAGGTVGSPQILQLSGVGPSTKLTPLGIDTRIDLPVGYNLQDHVSYSMYWSAPTDVVTWAVLQNDQGLRASALTEYEASGTGLWTYINEAVGYPAMSDLMSSSSLTSYIKSVNSGQDQLLSQVTEWQALPANVSTGLAAQYKIMQDRLSTDVGQLEIILTMLGNNGAQNQLGIQVALQHPWSRGSIFINSKDPFTAPLIDPDYFGVGYDIDIMSYGSEFARKLAQTAPLSDVMTAEVLPGAGVTGDALNNYTKRAAGTEYHPLGTCSMLPRESGGVVDTNLLVYGSANLRVIDASIMPLQISAHLMASTYGIAEKGADIIKQKYWKVEATNTTANGTDASETTASPGDATDSAVTANNNLSSDSSSGLSNAAKIGIGAGVGVGAAIILAALIVFCCMRRKKQAPGGKGGWYDPASTYDTDPSGAYKESARGPSPSANNAYPMAPFAHSRSESVATMATADLAAQRAVRSESGFGLSGIDTPYRDHSPPPGAGMTQGQGGYGVAGEMSEGMQYPRQQTYRPVNL